MAHNLISYKANLSNNLAFSSVSLKIPPRGSSLAELDCSQGLLPISHARIFFAILPKIPFASVQFGSLHFSPCFGSACSACSVTASQARVHESKDMCLPFISDCILVCVKLKTTSLNFLKTLPSNFQCCILGFSFLDM